jgi:hypothetical protein
MKNLFAALFILMSSVVVFGQRSISGTVTDSLGNASAGRIKLYRTIGVFVDSLDFIDGTYEFTNVPIGNYYVITRGDTVAYPNHIRTYYGQKPHWQNATMVTITDTTNALTNIDITLIQIPNWSGSNNTGYCSGTILRENGLRAGDPIPGIDVSLEQIPGGIIKANTETDENGFFEIKKIPDNSKYNLIVDLPGLTMDSTHTVEIAVGDSAFCLDFIVDTSSTTAGIYATDLTLTSIYSLEEKEYNIAKIYPNPSSGLFTIELVANESSIIVFAIDGKTVMQNKIYSNKARLDLRNQPKGIYFIEIKDTFGVQKLKVLVE